MTLKQFLILRDSWSSLIIFAKPEIEKRKSESVLHKVTLVSSEASWDKRTYLWHVISSRETFQRGLVHAFVV